MHLWLMSESLILMASILASLLAILSSPCFFITLPYVTFWMFISYGFYDSQDFCSQKFDCWFYTFSFNLTSFFSLTFITKNSSYTRDETSFRFFTELSTIKTSKLSLSKSLTSHWTFLTNEKINNSYIPPNVWSQQMIHY